VIESLSRSKSCYREGYVIMIVHERIVTCSAVKIEEELYSRREGVDPAHAVFSCMREPSVEQ